MLIFIFIHGNVIYLLTTMQTSITSNSEKIPKVVFECAEFLTSSSRFSLSLLSLTFSLLTMVYLCLSELSFLPPLADSLCPC
jgi:hypothetical protein